MSLFNLAALLQAPVTVFTNLYSVLFDGVDEYGNETGGTAGDYERTDSFSVSGWFKTTDSGVQMFITKQLNSSTIRGWGIFLEAGLIKVSLITDNGTSKRIFKRTNAAHNNGVWKHFCFTYNGTSLASGLLFYVDGSAVATTTDTDDLNDTIDNAATLQIAARGGNNTFTGNIDEVSIWNKTLSAAEVAEIYNSGNPADLSAHSASANLINWWRMGDDDTHPTLTDNAGSADITLINTESGDIEADVP